MRKSLLLLFLFVVAFTSCTDRHDRESLAMQNLESAYPEPTLPHFQHAYESIIRAVTGAVNVEKLAEQMADAGTEEMGMMRNVAVFNGVRKVVHFNDSKGSGFWFNPDSGLETRFFEDLKSEDYELFLELKREGQAITLWVQSEEEITGAVVMIAGDESIQAFDLAGTIDLKELSKLLQKGDLNDLKIIDFSDIEI